MPASLPLATETKLENLPNALSAYNVCLALEKKATTDKNRMHARILGYLIIHAPSSIALAEIVKVVHSYTQDEKTLFDLGECFLLWFIRPFKKHKERTLTPSDHPSRSSFDRVKDDLKAKIKVAPKDHKEAKTQALIRDGYRCAVTGICDVIAETGSLVDVEAIKAAGGTVHTELAHILPESTYFDVSSTRMSSSDNDYSASVLAVLRRFGYDVEQVNGLKVHSLYNVITMQKNAQDAFDRLEMWFESTEVTNRYRVRTTRLIYSIPGKATFVSPDPLILPYPSQEFLNLHAACAKVAHLSGASEYIDKFDHDADNLDVLATDGSSSAVLTHALLKSISRQVDTVA